MYAGPILPSVAYCWGLCGLVCLVFLPVARKDSFLIGAGTSSTSLHNSHDWLSWMNSVQEHIGAGRSAECGGGRCCYKLGSCFLTTFCHWWVGGGNGSSQFSCSGRSVPVLFVLPRSAQRLVSNSEASRHLLDSCFDPVNNWAVCFVVNGGDSSLLPVKLNFKISGFKSSSC